MIHSALQTLPVVDNELQVGGTPLRLLVERAGRTPLYVYDRRRMTERVAELRRCLPPIELHYAMKANPMPAVVQHMSRLVDGLDVASHGELLTALDTELDPSQISFAGPAKLEHELRAAVAAGVVLNVESPSELRRIGAVGQALRARPKIALRVNPDFDLKAGMKMGGGAKPFGIDAEQVTGLFGELRTLAIDLTGLHIFTGSQCLNSASLLDAQQRTFALAERLCQAWEAPFSTVNIGGGLGVPYFVGDQPLDLAEIGANLKRLLAQHARWLGGAKVVIELGRYLVAEAGYYVCRVVDRKVSRGQTYLLCDGGLHHHLANSGNFGQVFRKNYPVVVGNRVHGQEREVVSVQGPLCTPLDILADKVELPRADVGDLIVVLQSGAYGATASPQAFLGHPPAIEVLV